MPMLTFTRRRTLFTMIVFCAVSLGLMVWDVRLPQVTVRSVFLFVLYPFQYVWSSGVQFVNDSVERVGRLRELEEELSDADKMIVELQSKFLLFSQLEKENETLRQVLDVKKRIQYDTLYTRVINKNLDMTSSRILIDKGFADGVRRNHAVVGYTAEHGFYIVGKVIEVNMFTSVVEVVYSENFFIGGLLPNGALGVLNGQGAWNQYCVMSYVPSEALVEVGDVIVTSDESDIFPAGFNIGVVAGMTSSLRQEFFKRLYVRPFYHPMQSQMLFVVKWSLLNEGEARE